MTEYRTPDEQQATDEQDARIRAVLDKAVHDGASCVIAMDLGEDPEVVEHWVDAYWNGLRDGLSGDADHPGLRSEDALAAIDLLLEAHMRDEADKVLRAVRGDR